MRRFVVCALGLSFFSPLGGCVDAPAPKFNYAEHMVARETELSAWQVECADDFHGTIDRVCSVKNGKYFIVSYVNGKGPYVQAGPYSSPGNKNVVRVDNGRV